MGNISFLDYDKVTDTLMFFNQTINLNFCVSLTKRSQKTNEDMHYHSEFKYYSDKFNRDAYSLKRIIDCYFCINDTAEFLNSVIIRPKDIILLRYLLDEKVLPWFKGNKRVFSFDNNGKLILKGKFQSIQFPISDYKYLEFLPIIYTYQDDTTKEGLRIIINSPDHYADIDINKFFEFYYYMTSVDMYTAATSILTYIKTQPYEQNLFAREEEVATRFQPSFDDGSMDGGHIKNFFNK